MMAITLRKRRISLILGALVLGAFLAWFFTHDREGGFVTNAVREYVGDLQTQRMTSASRRIFPHDLLELKKAALEKAGSQEAFRQEALEFFQAKDMEEVRLAPKERFFEFLLLRAYVQHPRLFDYLSRGQIVGVRMRRHGEEAWAWVYVDVESPEGLRRLTLQASLRKWDGVWWIRL